MYNFFSKVKVITCSGSNIPLATPVAISTTLPPSVAALNQQGIAISFIYVACTNTFLVANADFSDHLLAVYKLCTFWIYSLESVDQTLYTASLWDENSTLYRIKPFLRER